MLTIFKQLNNWTVCTFKSDHTLMFPNGWRCLDDLDVNGFAVAAALNVPNHDPRLSNAHLRHLGSPWIKNTLLILWAAAHVFKYFKVKLRILSDIFSVSEKNSPRASEDQQPSRPRHLNNWEIQLSSYVDPDCMKTFNDLRSYHQGIRAICSVFGLLSIYMPSPATSASVSLVVGEKLNHSPTTR